MHLRALSLVSLFVVVVHENAHAQCPDGSAPPCRSAIAIRPAIDANAVAILPFQVTGPSVDVAWMAEGGMDLLAIALDGLGGLRVISPRTLLPHTRHFAGQSAATDVSRLARSVGAGTVVLGRVVANGTQLVISAELYETERSRRLAASSARGMLANPGPLIDSLAIALLKQRISGQSARARRKLDDYGTASPAALRAFLVAEQLMRTGQWQAAADSLRKVIERDSTFGLAWYQLFRTFWWGGADNGFELDTDTIIKGARRDSIRLPRRIRLTLRAIQATDRGERLEALRSADELAAAYPDDPEAALVYADIYIHYGLASGESPVKLIAAFEHAIALDPAVPEAYAHLVDLHCMLGDTTSAWRAHARQVAVAPDWEPNPTREIAMRALFRGESPRSLIRELPSGYRLGVLVANILICGDTDPARAIRLADSFAVVATEADQPRPLRTAALTLRHDLYFAQGQYQKAWSVLGEAASLDPERVDVLGRMVTHGLIAGSRTTETERALERLAKHATVNQLVGRGLVPRIWQLATIGRMDSIPSLYTGTFLMREDWTPYREALLAGLQGLAYLNTNDSVRARALLTRAYAARNTDLSATVWGAPDRRFTLALAKLDRAAGDLQSAVRRLHDMIFYIGLLERAEAEELRGQIEEQRGDTAAAVHAYRNFIALWQNADPQLQPRVAAARAALARLERP